MNSIKVGICGYGDLGRDVERALRQSPDMELTGVYTRRDPESGEMESPGIELKSIDVLSGGKEELDVVIICADSADELLELTPELAKKYNVIDSFDTRAKALEHFAKVDTAAGNFGHVAVIGCGRDPGLLSLNRLFGSIIPKGKSSTSPGKGEDGSGSVTDCALEPDSGPELMASVLVAYARAAARLAGQGKHGCFTVFDIAPALLHPQDDYYQRKNLL